MVSDGWLLWGWTRVVVCTYLEGGEVNDIVNVGVLFKNLVERGLVCDVDFVEGWPLTADQLDAVADFRVRVVEAVDDDHLVVCLEKGQGREGANVAGTAAPLSIYQVF